MSLLGRSLTTWSGLLHSEKNIPTTAFENIFYKKGETPVRYSIYHLR